jgi:hypothetical protein
MKQTASYGLGLKLSNSKYYCSGYYGVPSFSFSAKYYQTSSHGGRSFLLSSNKNIFKFSTSQTKFQKRFNDNNNNNNNNNAFIFRFSHYTYCTDKGNYFYFRLMYPIILNNDLIEMKKKEPIWLKISKKTKQKKS